jgi:hypothetical protein
MQVRRTSFAVQASAVRRERMAKQNAKRAAHRDDHRKLVEAQDKILMLALSTGAEVAQDLNVWTLTWPLLDWHKEILKQEQEQREIPNPDGGRAQRRVGTGRSAPRVPRPGRQHE